MEGSTTSCQVNISRNVWLKFRKMCLSEGIAASARVRAMIEQVVAASHVESMNARDQADKTSV